MTVLYSNCVLRKCANKELHSMFPFSDNRPIMYEKSFLQAVAYQNYSKYDVKPTATTPVIVSF